MATLSLLGSIRTCKVDTAYANKLQSDRFLNPAQMLCPPWNGVDTSGRPTCADAYYTKTPGCNSASDRILVENSQRPQYMSLVTLDAHGLLGENDCTEPVTNMSAMSDMRCQQNALKNAHQQAGQFGYTSGFMQNIQGNCATCPDAMAYQTNAMKQRQWANQGMKVQQIRRRAGI